MIILLQYIIFVLDINNGITLQFGQISTAQTYTFPISFSSNCYFVIVNWNGGKSGYFYPVDSNTYRISTSQFHTNMSSNSMNVKGNFWFSCGF